MEDIWLSGCLPSSVKAGKCPWDLSYQCWYDLHSGDINLKIKMAEWLTRRTSNLRIADVGSNHVKKKIEQETLHLVPGTD
jgi:hypothetical protein